MREIKDIKIHPSMRPFVYETFDQQCRNCDSFQIIFTLFDDVKAENLKFMISIPALFIQERLNEISLPAEPV